tara:strand:- start:8397 stop:10040 length:1644 start_codon:yes stop_codon:yes gene_type:complete
MKKLRLNVMLLSDDVDFTDPDSFIKDYSSDKEINFDKAGVEAILYHKRGNIDHPSWVKSFVNKIGGIDLRDIIPKNQSHGITLYVKVGERVFAINWGQSGRFNTKQEKIDKKFGIYVANKLLNSDAETRIKSAQSRVNQTNPINKERQYGEHISSDEILLSMEDNEAFKELNIAIADSLDFLRMIGKYSSLNVQFAFEDDEMPALASLPAKLQKLLEIYASVSTEDIKKLFKGLFPVDSQTAQALNGQLPTEILKEDTAFFLFEPEIDFDFSSVTHFKISTDGKTTTSEELRLSEYTALKTAVTVEELNSDTLSIIDEDDTEIKQWSIFECLYGEMMFDGTNYILSHGEWFEVATDKYERITQKIEAITTNNLNASDTVKTLAQERIQAAIDDPAIKKVDKERIFNTAWCEDMNGELFDEIRKQVVIYEDRFEVCDIFLPQDGKFIHVKFNSGANALGHLFNQGYVSASSFAKFEDKYIENVNAHITTGANHLAAPKNGKCVHFVILNNRRVNRLTFFSKMALEDRVTTLEGWGFIVKLSWINNAYQ